MADTTSRHSVEEAANAAAGRAREQLSAGVDRIRDTGEQVARGAADAIGSGRDDAAGILDRGADYLRSADVGDMLSDAGDFIRRRPGITLIAAVLAGFLVARALRAK